MLSLGLGRHRASTNLEKGPHGLEDGQLSLLRRPHEVLAEDLRKKTNGLSITNGGLA